MCNLRYIDFAPQNVNITTVHLHLIVVVAPPQTRSPRFYILSPRDQCLSSLRQESGNRIAPGQISDTRLCRYIIDIGDAAGIQQVDNRKTHYHDNADDRVQASLTANVSIRG